MTTLTDRYVAINSDKLYEITNSEGLRIGEIELKKNELILSRVVVIKPYNAIDILLEMGWIRNVDYKFIGCNRTGPYCF
jgi:hypothetical protein